MIPDSSQKQCRRQTGQLKLGVTVGYKNLYSAVTNEQEDVVFEQEGSVGNYYIVGKTPLSVETQTPIVRLVSSQYRYQESSYGLMCENIRDMPALQKLFPPFQ